MGLFSPPLLKSVMKLPVGPNVRRGGLNFLSNRALVLAISTYGMCNHVFLVFGEYHVDCQF